MSSLRVRAEASLLPWAMPGLIASVFFIERNSRHGLDGRLFTLFDDAAISLTYSRTLARTGELVWFEGAERVEGISNLGWTLVMTLVHLLGFSGSRAALVISLLGLVILLLHSLAVGNLVLLLAPERRGLAGPATLLTGISYPLLFWTLRGFETGLIALLIVMAVSTAIRWSRTDGAEGGRLRLQFTLISAGLVSIRLDALIVPVLSLLWLLWVAPSARRQAIRASLVVGATLGALTLWRLAYYGVPVPNTYFLKVAEAPLRFRLTRGIMVSSSSNWAVAALAIAVLASVLLPLRRLRRLPAGPSEQQFVGSAFLALLAYSIYVGGDAWEWAGFANRFVSPGIGLAIGSVLVWARSSAKAVRFTEASAPREVRREISRAIALGASALLAGLALAGPSLTSWVVHRFMIDEVIASRLGRGADLGPSEWAFAFELKIAPALLVGAALAMTVGVLASAAPGRKHVLVVALLIGAVANPSMSTKNWYRALHAQDDAWMVRFGESLREATDESATIATVWAGNPAYFAERPMIDLLGKSDPVIARTSPLIESWEKLYPGHNKWDYSYSIGELRPDIVAQLWVTTEDDLLLIADAGYERHCLLGAAVWIRMDSDLVDLTLFERRPTGRCEDSV